ncbi:MAG: AzlC family ABC transporter permease [Salinisphaera sp.]|jgi:predicted branched-subunit amino acid permease|nr:AzlC family ABC transporter permease [Salinisphaera sp.]
MTTEARRFAGSDFFAGIQAMTPILISIVPFAMITGVVGVRLGLSVWQVTAGSLLMFAGTAQIAAMQLFVQGTPLLVILATVFFINLRFVMYSASIASHVRGAPPWAKALVAYPLTDQSFMVSLYGFEQRRQRGQRLRFYAGAALSLWGTWQLALLGGALLGGELPQNWGLEFAVPLTFLALLVPAIVDRATIAAAVVAAVVAVVAHSLPWNTGLIAGALAGIAAGLATARVTGSAS